MFYMGLGTGVGIFDFRDAGRTVFIPLGAFAGVSVPKDDEPLLDIGLSFDFTQLFQPGADRVVEPRTYVGALRMRMYFFL
jgi:hypothetical protein